MPSFGLIETMVPGYPVLIAAKSVWLTGFTSMSAIGPISKGKRRELCPSSGLILISAPLSEPVVPKRSPT